MNNKLNIVSATMILFAVMLISCKKEKNDNNGNNSIAGKYRMTALVEIKDGVETDQFPLIDDCTKDDVLEFRSNKTYVYTDAGTTCVPDGSDAGTWEAVSTSKMKVDGEQVTIVSKTDSQLVLQRTETLGGETLDYKITYTRL